MSAFALAKKGKNPSRLPTTSTVTILPTVTEELNKNTQRQQNLGKEAGQYIQFSKNAMNHHVATQKHAKEAEERYIQMLRDKQQKAKEEQERRLQILQERHLQILHGHQFPPIEEDDSDDDDEFYGNRRNGNDERILNTPKAVVSTVTGKSVTTPSRMPPIPNASRAKFQSPGTPRAIGGRRRTKKRVQRKKSKSRRRR